MYVLSVCLLQKRARSLELAPDQIRNQLVFDNPEQHSFRGGAPSGEHSFFNNHYNNNNNNNNGNTFYRDQQQLSSFTGSSTNLDKQFASGQQILATTYKPTFNLHRLHQQSQLELQQRQQPEIHSSLPFQAPTRQRDSSPSIEIVPSISLSDSFNRESLPSQQTYNNAFQQTQDPRYYRNQQTQQNAFLHTNPHHFNNQAINFQQHQQQLQLQHQQLLQEQNRRNGVAESRVYNNQVPNSYNNGRYFNRFNFHGPSEGRPFVQ
jgi:predicted secreted protein